MLKDFLIFGFGILVVIIVFALILCGMFCGGPGATIDNSSGNRSRDKNRDTRTDTNKNTGIKQDVAKQKEAQQNKPSGF
jgi:hypothetical protein